ncbi:MAG: precorrin-6A/cobalt-precorrin-6A reductase, partial [Rikenellaceae bacterium]
MILIFGGTTEGRVAVDVCEQAAKCYLYSTRSGEQRLALSYGEELSGDMCQCDMVELAKLRDVDLIIDAAHPYASGLHHNLTSAAAELSIPVIRFERESQPATYPGVVMLDSMDDAVEYISSHSLHGVLALTGVKSAQFLTPISRRCGVVLRIMDREESNWEVERTSFPKENIIYYDFDNTHSLKDLCRELRITSILTKESGEAGGYGKKVAVAQELDIPLLVIKRPELPQYQSAVFGPHSLRRSIEELLPTYFGLRTGFTSGSAATAATTAALMAGVCSVEANSVEIYLPSGEPITLPVAYAKTDNCLFEACVIKDGGDDPDATHNLEFISRVSLAPCCGEESEVRIVGGEGVGVVTLHGLGIEVGQHAINPVPRQMITDNVLRFLARRSLKCIVEVEISVPR